MEVTLAGMVIVVRLLQLLNALSPMEVNCEPDSNVTVVRLVQFENASFPMEVTSGPIITVVISLLLFVNEPELNSP